MFSQEANTGMKERLDEFIKRAEAGQEVRLDIRVYRNLVKQINRSESTDDIDIETDLCLLMADFTPVRRTEAKLEKVTKVYAVCPINESEIDAKTTRYIANERLKIDYARLKEVKIQFEEIYF